MNRTNRTSNFRLARVKAGVRALPEHRAPYIRGGMGHKSAGGCYTAHFSILLYHSSLPTTTRPDRADTEEKGKTGATPPFLPLVRHSGVWFGAVFGAWYAAQPSPHFGVAPVQIIPAGRLSRADLQYPVTAEAERRLSAWARPVRRMATPLCRLDCRDHRS